MCFRVSRKIVDVFPAFGVLQPCPVLPCLLLHGWRWHRNGAQQPFRFQAAALCQNPPGAAGASSALQYPGKGKAEPTAPACHVISCYRSFDAFRIIWANSVGLDGAFHRKIEEHADWPVPVWQLSWQCKPSKCWRVRTLEMSQPTPIVRGIDKQLAAYSIKHVACWNYSSYICIIYI